MRDDGNTILIQHVHVHVEKLVIYYTGIFIKLFYMYMYTSQY